MPPGQRPAAEKAGFMHSTKQRLIAAGLPMLLIHGYNDLGIQALLSETGIPKGSFYHHFKDKEDFALQVLDSYMAGVHAGLDASLRDTSHPPLDRIRTFFAMTQQSYREEGYMGCLIGGLGQELSGISEVFRHRIENCFSVIADRLANCLEEAQRLGDISGDRDVRHLADLLVNCWEGAALRSRLRHSPEALTEMIEFFIKSVVSA